MSWLALSRGLGFRLLVAGVMVAILTGAADARQRHRPSDAGHRSARGEDYTPPAASIVIDGATGAVLQASNSNVRCHPASLTKVMTLYLLFERLEAGEPYLDDLLKISEHASEQAPSKLDLRPGQTITVEDAIKGIVTKSANDAAVAVAEGLGQSEGNFAKLMTQKARSLGMASTTYVNASGLPDDIQVTTAKDQALLGRAIQERFPRYYSIFRPKLSSIAAKRCAITIICSGRWKGSTALRQAILAPLGSITYRLFIGTAAISSPSYWVASRPLNATPDAQVDRCIHQISDFPGLRSSTKPIADVGRAEEQLCRSD